MTKKIQKCYIYTRVSTAIQVDGYSLEAQKDKLRKYAEFQDYSIAGEYSDEGFSGKNIQGRLDFQRMLKDILDLQRRYDDLYDKIAEAEQQMEEIRKQIQTIRSEQISGENVYQLLLAFDELYSELDELDKKALLRAIIERVDLYPEKRPDGNWIRNIVFTFPVPVQGHEVKELPLEKSTLIETVCLLYHQKEDFISMPYEPKDASLLKTPKRESRSRYEKT